MSTNSEAPQSVSSVIYYRGVSMTITKRDPEISIKPLVEKQMEMIDWALDEKSCKPSWNEDTNKQALAKNTNVTHPELQESSEAKICPIHPGVAMEQKNGKFGPFHSHVIGKSLDGKTIYCNGK